MKNFLLLSLVLFFLPKFSLAQKTVSIFFETKKTELSEDAKSQLTNLSNDIKMQKLSKISIIGFADADGSDALNQSLSEQRAATVKAFLIEKGISSNQILAVGRGKLSTDLDKNRSRRVDILVEFAPQNTPSVISTKPTVPSKPIPNMMALYGELGTPIQTFKIRTDRDTILRGAKGTAIFIPKNAFEGVPANAIVDFKLKEAYSMGDILSDNLNTMSGDKILQTGGMIYTEAQLNGEKLELQEPIQVSFASVESKQEGMQLYSGIRDPQQNGKINWELMPTELEETTAYMASPTASPFLLRDGKKGYVRFKDWVDVSSCTALFKNNSSQNHPLSKDLNAACVTMVTRVNAEPLLKSKTAEELHRIVFYEMYQFYQVENLADLQKQNGARWDSLLTERMKTYDLTEEGDEKRRLRDEYIAQQVKAKMAVVRLFPASVLGWINCDALPPPPSSNERVVIKTNYPDSDAFSSNVSLIYKRGGYVVEGYSKDKKDINFTYIPKDVDAYVVGVKLEKGQPYLALHTIKTDNLTINLDFKPVTTAEIKRIFGQFN